MLKRVNKLVLDFEMVYEQQMAGNEDFQVVIKADRRPPDGHKGRYNAPTVSEVAVVLVGEAHAHRDIVLKKRDKTLQRIDETPRMEKNRTK